MKEPNDTKAKEASGVDSSALLDPNDVADKIETLCGEIKRMYPFVSLEHRGSYVPELIEEAKAYCDSIRSNAEMDHREAQPRS